MTINNKSERNYRGKCLGWPVTSYGAEHSTINERNKYLRIYVFTIPVASLNILFIQLHESHFVYLTFRVM